MSVLDNVIKEASQVRTIYLDNPYIKKLDMGSTSKGNQPKYYDYSTNEYIKEQFYYQDIYWKDYMVEVLSSVIAKELHTSIQIVHQTVAELSNGRFACISKDFSKDDYDWVPMSRTKCYEQCKKERGKSFKIFTAIKDYFGNIGLDITEYLVVMIIMDFLLGNEDRHYGNFGFLKNKDGSVSVAPLFDFGLGLFEHDINYRAINLYTAKLKMDGKPFDIDLQNPVDMLFNSGYGSLVYSIFKDITIPNKELFPNDLGYQYFINSYSYLKERMKEYEICW